MPCQDEMARFSRKMSREAAGIEIVSRDVEGLGDR